MIKQTISPDDKMFLGNRDHYFSVGDSAVAVVKIALQSAGKQPSEIKTVLDYGCGHGRVMRHFVELFPQASFSATDYDETGIEFCMKEFGATRLDERAKFDLIWVGCVFTHLSMSAWVELLEQLRKLSVQNGLIIFTTAGQYVASLIRSGDHGGVGSAPASRMLITFDLCGFGYSRYLDSPADVDYGRAIAKPAFVLALLEHLGFDTKLACEKKWDQRQDVYAVSK